LARCLNRDRVCRITVIICWNLRHAGQPIVSLYEKKCSHCSYYGTVDTKLSIRKSIRPVNVSVEVLVSLSVWSEVQIIGICGRADTAVNPPSRFINIQNSSALLMLA